MQKSHAAARLLSDALGELNALRQRKSIAAGDGFADGFPIERLAALLSAKLARPLLGKADWVAFGAVSRT